MTKNDDGEAAAAFYDKRRKWLDWISEHDEISHAAFRVGYFIARRMNGDNQCCWFSVPAIAKRLGSGAVRDDAGHIRKVKRVSTRTVSDAIIELELAGALIVVRKPGRESTYYLRAPFD
jgi:hypothetical protein